MAAPTSFETRLQSLEQRTSRAEISATASANGLATVEQQMGSLTREVRAARSDIKVGFESLRGRLAKIEKQVLKPTRETLSLSEEDWEDSPTGMHKMVSKRTFEQWRNEVALDEDGRKWRQLWRRVRWAVWAIVGGAATYGGEQLIQYLAHHL